MTDRKMIHVMVAIQPDGEAFNGTRVATTDTNEWRREQVADIAGFDIDPASRFYVVTTYLPIPTLADRAAASVKEVDDVEF